MMIVRFGIIRNITCLEKVKHFFNDCVGKLMLKMSNLN